MGSDLIVARLGYLGIILVLVLGGLGLPVPEEAPIILAAVLSRNGKMLWPLALASCFVGVLVGDFIVYALGYFQGERVLSFRITRRFLTREREAQIKGYFHRHGMRILITGRFVPGFRTAAYLTAGILRMPPLKLFLADLCAASLTTLLMFGLGYFFAHVVENGIKQAQSYVFVALAVGVVGWILHHHYKARKRGGLAVGPPVSVTDEVPLPVDDLHSGLMRNPLIAHAPGPTETSEPPMVERPKDEAEGKPAEVIVLVSEVVVVEQEVAPSCVIASPALDSPLPESPPPLPSPMPTPSPRPASPTSSRPVS